MSFGHSHIFPLFYHHHVWLSYKQEKVQLKMAAVTQQPAGSPSEGGKARHEREFKSARGGENEIMRIVKSHESQGGLLGQQRRAPRGFPTERPEASATKCLDEEAAPSLQPLGP